MYECKEIPDYEGLYEIDVLGNIYSLNYRRKLGLRGQLKPWKHKYGYDIIALSKPGLHKKKYTIHQLVMLTFVGPRPEGMDIRHLNGDTSDSRLENLAYGTASENSIDMVYHQTNPTQKLTPQQALDIFNDSRSNVEIGFEYGITRTQVHYIKSGKQWSHLTGKVYVPRKNKLTVDQIIAIYFDKRINRIVGEEYGVSEAVAQGIKSGTRYKQITERFRVNHSQPA